MVTPDNFPLRSGLPFRYLILCIVALAELGCVSNRAYRDKDSRPWARDVSMTFVQGEQKDQYEPYAAPGHPFDLSYIEFDDKGDFWDRRQLAWTVQAIKRVAEQQNIILVMYIHGWQNDASSLRGHDVEKFHCLLERLAQADDGSHRYFGVYIGWRGKSVPGGDGVFPDGSPLDYVAKGLLFIPHELSFFSRKSAATRVADLPVTEAIFQSVASTRKEARRHGHQSRTILVGHSFGALVLEKALAQALAAKMISEEGETFTAPADFVVLLNSAGESIYAKEMIDMLRRRAPKGGSGNLDVTAEHPLVVSITSTADWATGKLFPIGTTLASTTGTFRQYEWDDRYGTSSQNVPQREYFTQTPGHNQRLISHRARVQAGEPRKPTFNGQSCNDEKMLAAFQRNLREPLTGKNGQIQFVTISKDEETTRWELESQIERKDLRTPYWIVEVPKEIIRDHSDVFNENAIALMARLFRIANPEAQAGKMMTGPPRTMRLSDPR